MMSAVRTIDLSALVAAFGLAMVAALLPGCGPDVFDYECAVTWFDGPESDLVEVGSTTFSYPGLGEAGEATDMCDVDQAESEDRPVLVSEWECSCVAQEE